MSLSNLSTNTLLRALPQDVLEDLISNINIYTVINSVVWPMYDEYGHEYNRTVFLGVFTVLGPPNLTETEIVNKLFEKPEFYRNYLSNIIFNSNEIIRFNVPLHLLEREIIYILSLLGYDMEKYRQRLISGISGEFRVFKDNQEIMKFNILDYLDSWNRMPSFNDLENRLMRNKVIKPRDIPKFIQFLQSRAELPDSISSLSEYFRDHVL